MKNRTVLCVDDEKMILSALRRVLKGIPNLDIRTAETGEEALGLLNDCDADVIISDEKMPGMSGHELLARIQSERPETIRILLTGYADIKAIQSSINQGKISRLIMKPWNDEEIRSAVVQGIELRRIKEENTQFQLDLNEKNRELNLLNRSLDDMVKKRTSQLEKAIRGLKLLSGNLSQTLNNTVELLNDIMTFSNRFVGNHCRRVSIYATALCETMNLPHKEIEAVRHAALFHDIGLLSTSEPIHAVSLEGLSKLEAEIYLDHPLAGEAFIESLENLAELAKIVRHHHENYNGKGFPDGLSGKEIPLGARIIRVADVFDLEMINNPGERFEVQNSILKDRNRYFDPDILEAWKICEAELPTQRFQKKSVKTTDLSSGMILSKPIRLASGAILVPEGTLLDKSTIKKITTFRRLMPKNIKVEILQ